MTPSEVVAIAAGGSLLGTGFGGWFVKYLANKWLADRDKFESDTTSKLSAHEASIGAAKDHAESLVSAHRRESQAARDVLRDEDLRLRDRYHELSGHIQTLFNQVKNAEINVERAFKANTDMVQLFMEKSDESSKQVHSLELAITKLAAAINGKH